MALLHAVHDALRRESGSGDARFERVLPEWGSMNPSPLPDHEPRMRVSSLAWRCCASSAGIGLPCESVSLSGALRTLPMQSTVSVQSAHASH